MAADKNHFSRRRALAAMAGAASGLLLPSLAGCEREPHPERSRHIVMICIDDLNDYPGYLGGYAGDAQTPNLDALAASGRAYLSAHCCVPICRPSRNAVLFGKAPWNLPTLSSEQKTAAQREEPALGRYRALLEAGVAQSLPRLLKQHSAEQYVTASMGKVFHQAVPEQWDRQAPFTPLGQIYARYPSASGDHFSYGILPEGAVHQDQATADWAGGILSQAQDQPLFLAVGLYQPHLPWHLPQWAYDLHPLDSVVLPEYRPQDLDDVPHQARQFAWQPEFGGTGNFDLAAC